MPSQDQRLQDQELLKQKRNIASYATTWDGKLSWQLLLKNHDDHKFVKMIFRSEEFYEKYISLEGYDKLPYNSEKILDNSEIIIAEALRENNTVTRLDIVHRKISDKSAEELAETLRINTHLKDFTLRGVDISDKGMKAIAEALKINKSLTRIDFSPHEMGPEGVGAIAEALKVNNVLENVTFITGVEGFKMLGEALKENINITYFHRRHMDLAPEAIGVQRSISDILERNNAIKNKKNHNEEQSDNRPSTSVSFKMAESLSADGIEAKREGSVTALSEKRSASSAQQL